MKNFLAIVFFGVITSFSLKAQVKIGGNISTIDNRSILELESDSLGMLITRLNNTERDAKTNWKIGNVIYNKSDSCFQFYDGNKWECMVGTRNANSLNQAPRKTTTQINALTNVVNGDVVYNTTENCLQVRIDSKWVCITDASIRQGQGGGAVGSLLNICGCADDTTMVGGSSGSPKDLTGAMQKKCGIILSISSTSTAYFRLPNPADFKDRYFCMVLHGFTSTSNIAYLTRPSNQIAVMHWHNLLKGEGLVSSITIQDFSNTRMVMAKVLSDGVNWFFAAGY